MDYRTLMMTKPLIQVMPDTKLAHGQLIGFKAFADKEEITAAYPIWAQNGNEIQFVLYTKDGRPCIDNDWIRENTSLMFTNMPAIVVPLNIKKNPTTFQNELSVLFTNRSKKL